MSFLNYHHLRYFRAIARELNLTRAAESLNLSPPALSIQLKQLEESLGHPLFERGRGGLTLTEAGRLALDYADTIGRAGEELMDVMQHRPRGGRQVLRVGRWRRCRGIFCWSFYNRRCTARRWRWS